MKLNDCSFKEFISNSEVDRKKLRFMSKNKFNSQKTRECQMITAAASCDKNCTASNSFLPLELSDFYFTTIQNDAVPAWVQSDTEYAEKIAALLKTWPG